MSSGYDLEEKKEPCFKKLLPYIFYKWAFRDLSQTSAMKPSIFLCFNFRSSLSRFSSPPLQSVSRYKSINAYFLSLWVVSKTPSQDWFVNAWCRHFLFQPVPFSFSLSLCNYRFPKHILLQLISFISVHQLGLCKGEKCEKNPHC